MSKLTDLGTVTSLADDDLVYVVDISDTTDDPAGSSKGITKANLLGQGSAFTLTKKELIATITDPGAGGYVFSLPVGYDRFQVQGTVRGASAVQAINLRAYFNGDTADANYYFSSNTIASGASAPNSGASAFCGTAVAGTAPADSFSQFELAVEDPDGSSVKEFSAFVSAYRTATRMDQHLVVCRSSITAALTSLTIQADNDPTDLVTGTLYLYGEKEETFVPANMALATGTVVKEEIARITDPGTSEYDFSGLDFTLYDRLIVQGSLKHSAAAEIAGIRLTFNGDTTDANYWRQPLEANDGATFLNASASRVGGVAAGASASSDFADIGIIIEAPNRVSDKQAVCSYWLQNTTSKATVGSRVITNTTINAALTSLLIDSSDAGTLSGTLILYGERTL